MNQTRYAGRAALAVALLSLAAPAPTGAYEIEWWTVDGGGGRSAGGEFVLRGTAGQADAGGAAGGEYALSGGYWTMPPLATGVTEEPAPHYRLHANYPNPFNPKTTVRFDRPEAGPTRISIHDVSGRLVRTLLDGKMPAGRHAVDWDGRSDSGGRVASGVYFIRMRAGGFEARRKAVLLK